MNTRASVVIALSAVILAGCSQPAATPRSEASPTTSPTPSPSPSPPSRLKIGGQVALKDPNARVTVHGYKQPVAKNAPPPDQEGYEWGALDIQLCADSRRPDGGLVTVSQETWALLLADNGLIGAPSSTYQQFPLPQYPFFPREIPVGQCVRGWATFPVPKGQRPKLAQYAPRGVEPMIWEL